MNEPDNPLVADVGLVGVILGDKEWIVGKGSAQILGKELLAGVDHRFAAVIILEQVGKHLDAVPQLLGGPGAEFLNVDDGKQVLILALGRGDEVLELCGGA